MAWMYVQSTGKMYRPNGQWFHNAWSGRGEHLNNSASQCIKNEGPIPRGDWTMTTLYNTGPENDPRAGNPMPITRNNRGINNKRFIIKLMPQASVNVCNRDGFLIHGGGINASQGCIIVDGALIRKQIWDSGDHELRVVEILEITP